MGMERRGNNTYYYAKRREGGRVVSEYRGAGELGEALASLDAIDRARHEHEREALRAERAALADVDRQAREAGALIEDLAAAVLLGLGYHTHKGQWRHGR